MLAAAARTWLNRCQVEANVRNVTPRKKTNDSVIEGRDAITAPDGTTGQDITPTRKGNTRSKCVIISVKPSANIIATHTEDGTSTKRLGSASDLASARLRT